MVEEDRESISTLSAGDYIVYRTLMGELSYYKVISVTKNKKGETEARICGLDENGHLTGKGKGFVSTVKNLRHKTQRLFRLWVQPSDKVWVNEANDEGIISKFTIMKVNNKTVNMVNIVTRRGVQYDYPLEHLNKYIKLI